MKTIEIKLYSFNELSEEAQQRAHKIHVETLDYTAQMDMFSESCNERLKELGYESPEVSYSLGYSQGDGLSFKAKKYTKIKDLFLIELGKGKEKTAQLLAENTTQILKGNKGRYCYASKNDIDLYLENWTSQINVKNTNCIDSVIEKVRKRLEDMYMEVCKELEKNGYEEMEYIESIEYFKEECETNQWTFEEDGTMRNH